ncbi:MAG: hypothetical protein JNK56_23765 [Myxococcales bacterium]|nr:hypothetical protein [Myxococcales bacterium]
MIVACSRVLRVGWLAIVAGCGPAGTDVSGPAAVVPAEPVAVVPAEPAAVVAAEPAAVVPAEPVAAVPAEPVAAVPAEPVAAEPVAAAIDLATVAAVRARIVAIPNRKSWVPCGYIFSIGALEVEVLDAGEPPPRMVLLVACPVPMHGRKLEVGATVSVKLYARKQRWPAVGGLPKELVKRQVAEFVPEPGDPPR